MKEETDNWVYVNDTFEINPLEKQLYQKDYTRAKSQEILNRVFIYLKTLGTNLKYSLEDFSSSSLNELLVQNRHALILFGKEYTQENKDLLKKLVIEVSWFSYRKSLSFLYSAQNKAYSTDANWGCTIRVAQMHLFHVFIQHIKKKFENYNFTLEELVELRRALLPYFFDNIFSPFSIHQFCNIALERENAEIGKHWKPNATIGNMKRILEKNIEIKLTRATKPTIKINTKEIKLYITSLGIITWEDIVDTVCVGESLCDCGNKQTFQFYSSKYKEYDEKYCKYCDFNKTLNIFCFFRIGLQEPEPENIEYVKDLIKCEYFAGGLIGRKNSALFMLGAQDQYFIHLDPHFVQESQNKNLEQHFSTYNASSYRTIHQSNINPCLGVSFTVHSFDECIQLRDYIVEIQKKHKESFYLCFNKDLETDFQFIQFLHYAIFRSRFLQKQRVHSQNRPRMQRRVAEKRRFQ